MITQRPPRARARSGTRTARAPEKRVPARRPTPVRNIAPKGARRSDATPQRNGAGAIGSALVVLLFATAFGIVVFQVFLMQVQGRLDDVTRQERTEADRGRDLRAETARLEAPDRIARDARDRLGLVAPQDIGYLQPAVGDDTAAAFDPVREKAPVTLSPTTSLVPSSAASSPSGSTVTTKASPGAATSPTTTKLPGSATTTAGKPTSTSTSTSTTATTRKATSPTTVRPAVQGSPTKTVVSR